MHAQTKAYIALACTSIVWGTSWIASKIGVTHMPALMLSSVRQLIAGSLFVGFFLAKGEALPSKKELLQLMGLGILSFVFSNGFSTWGIMYLPAGLGALIGALYPLVVVLIEIIFLKKRNLHPMVMLGMLMGLAGVAYIFYDSLFKEKDPKFLFGFALSIFAMITWSVTTVIMSRGKKTVNPYFGIGWQLLFSSVLVYALAFATGNTIPLTDIPHTSWLSIFYLVAFGSIVALVAFIYSVKHLPASQASLYAYINPIVALLLGAMIFEHDHLTKKIVVGSALTLFGVFLVNHFVKAKKEMQTDGTEI